MGRDILQLRRAEAIKMGQPFSRRPFGRNGGHHEWKGSSLGLYASSGGVGLGPWTLSSASDTIGGISSNVYAKVAIWLEVGICSDVCSRRPLDGGRKTFGAYIAPMDLRSS